MNPPKEMTTLGRLRRTVSITLLIIIVSILALAMLGNLLSDNRGSNQNSTVSPQIPEKSIVMREKVTPLEIVVTSQIIKAVGGKYRYFFDIRNKDAQSFTGDVNINLVNALGQSIYDKDFTATEPISSGIGKSVYFDISTGPTSVHGENGIKTFTYVVKSNSKIVKSGSGTISTKLE